METNQSISNPETVTEESVTNPEINEQSQSPVTEQTAPVTVTIEQFKSIEDWLKSVKSDEENQIKVRKEHKIALATECLLKGETTDAIRLLKEAESVQGINPEAELKNALKELLREQTLTLRAVGELPEVQVSAFQVWNFLNLGTVGRSSVKVSQQIATGEKSQAPSEKLLDGTYILKFGSEYYRAVVKDDTVWHKGHPYSPSVARKVLESDKEGISMETWDANYIEKNGRKFSGHNKVQIFRVRQEWTEADKLHF